MWNLRKTFLAALMICLIGMAQRSTLAITIDDASANAPNENGTNSDLGVGYILTTIGASTFLGTGTLIDSTHVLTAAHVVVGAAPANITFSLTGNGENLVNDPATAYAVPNGYQSAAKGLDIAVITLQNPAPVGTTTWTYNTGQIADETSSGLTAHPVGFGAFGNGTNGATNNPGNPPGKRAATNQIDRVGQQGMPVGGWQDGLGNFLTPPQSTLLFDFDKVGANTPAGWPTGAGVPNWSSLTNKNTPLGTNGAGGSLEGDTAPGDSGGPTFQFDFTDNEFIITGVHSFGSDNNLARYGDIGVDTQVQAYSQFIQYYQANLPEPSAGTLVLVIGFAMVCSSRRMSRGWNRLAA
jgi:secreted trypsin-like serine protease